MDIASQIKAARQRAGLSQSQAAKAWGINLASLKNWEQAKSKPNADALLKLLPLLQPGKPTRSRSR